MTLTQLPGYVRPCSGYTRTLLNSRTTFCGWLMDGLEKLGLAWDVVRISRWAEGATLVGSRGS